MFLVFLTTFVFVFCFTLFYLDGFHLSSIKFIKFIQFLCPFLMVVLYISLFYLDEFSLNMVSFLSDKNNTNTVNIGANVEDYYLLTTLLVVFIFLLILESFSLRCLFSFTFYSIWVAFRFVSPSCFLLYFS